MDLIRFRRWRRKSASKSDQVNLGESGRWNGPAGFMGVGGHRSGDTIIPTAHETIIDESSTINTAADCGENDANESIVEIFRPELSNDSPKVRGATPSSDSSFLAFLKSAPRSGASRPRFPGVTESMDTEPAADTNTPPERPSETSGGPGPMPGFSMPFGAKSPEDKLMSLLEVFTSRPKDMGIDDDGAPGLGRKESSSRGRRGTPNWDPLHFVAQRGNARLCQSLLEHNADVEAKTETGWTPIFFAAQGGHFDACRVLLNHGALVNICDSGLRPQTPLIQAAHNGHLDVVKLLVSNGANVNFPAQGQPGYQGCPLFFGAISPNAEVCEFLIANGADTNNLDKDGNTPLLAAAAQASPNVIRTLTRHGALVNACNERGLTALHYATAYEKPGTLETLEALLEAKANVNAINKDGDTPLFHCITSKRADVAELLIRHGADVNVVNIRGFTVLAGCAGLGLLDIVDVLLKHGADVNLRSERGPTPLHMAAAQSDPAVVVRLLGAGANPHLSDNNKMTPLHVASQNDNEEVLMAMLDYGVNLKK